MQALRRVGEQIAVLVDGAALGGDIIPQRSQCLLQPGPAVDNQKLRLAQPALDQIVENGAPRRAGLATHVLDRQQHLLAVLANPEPDQEHNRGGFAVEPNPHHGAVEDQADDRLVSERAHVPGIPIGFYLPPHPAHGIFADRTAKDGSERPAHSTAVGAGKIGACDQRIGSPGSPLVSPQRRSLPFRGPARSGVEPSPRYRDLHSTESPDQRSGSMAVPVAGDLLRADGVVGSSLWPAAIARARKHRLELGFDHRLDEAANLVAQSGFNRIKPVVEEPGTCLGFRPRDWQLRAIIRHGVVSTGARTPDRWGFNTRRLRHLQFQPHPRRHQLMFRNILIPTDGSDLAAKAVEQAVLFAKEIGAKITAVTVTEPSDLLSVTATQLEYTPIEYQKHARAYAETVLGTVSDAAKSAGVVCDTLHVEHEQVYQAIIEAAEARRCDLIVMASHGRRGVSAVVLGSETVKVLTHSKIPVLVYR